jgi:hypothetical protein
MCECTSGPESVILLRSFDDFVELIVEESDWAPSDVSIGFTLTSLLVHNRRSVRLLQYWESV